MKIFPSILITNNDCPMIMTCRNHHHGAKKCTSLLHVLEMATKKKVVKSRTISLIEVTKYSNTNQMREQCDSFQSIDTCDVCEFVKF